MARNDLWSRCRKWKYKETLQKKQRAGETPRETPLRFHHRNFHFKTIRVLYVVRVLHNMEARCHHLQWLFMMNLLSITLLLTGVVFGGGGDNYAWRWRRKFSRWSPQQIPVWELVKTPVPWFVAAFILLRFVVTVSSFARFITNRP